MKYYISLKKTLLIYCIISACMDAGAQFNKGTKMVGAIIGSGSLSAGKTDVSAEGYDIFSHEHDLSFTPSLGWFVNNHSVVGVSLGIHSSRQKNRSENLSGIIFSESQTRSTDLGIGGFYRYYFTGTGQIIPFAHAYISGGTGDSRNEGFSNGFDYQLIYTNKTDNQFFYHMGINAGITKIFKDLIGFEASIGYLHSYTKQKLISTTLTTTSSSISSFMYTSPRKFHSDGVTLSLGLQFYFIKK